MQGLQLHGKLVYFLNMVIMFISQLQDRNEGLIGSNLVYHEK